MGGRSGARGAAIPAFLAASQDVEADQSVAGSFLTGGACRLGVHCRALDILDHHIGGGREVNFRFHVNTLLMLILLRRSNVCVRRI
ncbi:hypothetical protein HNE_0380 [Hyphomonas neptunium ATCC 15444]|uniref:Uncharacterized protein n=1 Tax=Hyphomonas neptunium (strain ATCC 15444) TaxID=228405 RepID=Q0C583_HYPNA|nr:hypothetical protein HNE_0380 [Hyphomonas neptunium ATCC 15444]